MPVYSYSFLLLSSCDQCACVVTAVPVCWWEACGVCGSDRPAAIRSLPIHMSVSNVLTLFDVQYCTQHSGVASIQRPLLGRLQGPAFKAIKGNRLHSRTEEAQVDVTLEVGFPYTSRVFNASSL